ncbi:MAG: SAM-dependent methyltransferase [Bacteroidales bacterium]|nr:SAM-dependent methyltransferase [Bacteroidales bacterium]MCL2739371.1 SAM-dependent methyltransferase [Bacteroidales bacterium]
MKKNIPTPGTLYLIPAPLAEGPLTNTLPQGTLAVILRLDCFVVEELRTARRYLSAAGLRGKLDGLTLFVLNEHTEAATLGTMLQPLLKGRDVGLLSEAGLPAVADPGSNLVALAHQKGIKVVPLTGPSSLMLALMASGLNGQSFAFAGYLPVKSQERKAAIKQLEKKAAQENQTQLFIETPYRNMALLGAILETCAPQTMLCVAANLTTSDAFVATKTVAQWRSVPPPPIHKIPTVFALQA